MAGRALRPLALIATAVVLVAFALGGWVPVARTIERARPFATPTAPKTATDPGRAQAEKAGIDVDAVVDEVRHRVTPADDGALVAHDEHYRARFDAQGFGFTLGKDSSRFGVSLRGVRRGGVALALVPGAWRGEANVAVRGLGSGMTERVTARAGELEWDVVLERRLAGTGNLRVEAALHWLDGVASRAGDHWRFPLSDGGVARMGEMVVKDADGKQVYRALPHVRGDILRLVVPATVLTAARYPLTIDPTVGPEQPAGGDPIYGAAPGSPETPAVASNGSEFLVVWRDYRQDVFPRGDVYGTRVSAAGTVLDPGGIAISTAFQAQGGPAVAWNGTNYLVVWYDARSGSGADIYGARVSGAGTVLDPAGIAISTAFLDQTFPAVAWNGTNFLVVWHDRRSNNNDIYGTRVNGAGGVLDPAGIAIFLESGAQDPAFPAVAWNGTNFLVVWQTNPSFGFSPAIYGTRVSSAGSVLDPAGIAIATGGAEDAAVAANGTSFLVVWKTLGGFGDIYGTRVTGAGSVLDPTGIPIYTAAGGEFNPEVGWNGTNFLVAWSGPDADLRGARVSPVGTVLDPTGIPIAVGARPAVAWNGTNFLVVWQDGRIRGGRVSPAGSVLDPAGILVSTAANTQAAPAVAWNGTEYLVVWEDHRSGTCCDIYGTRVSAAGSVLDPAGIAISTAASQQRAPALEWNGTDFFVAWEDSRSGTCCDIYGTRVSAAGSVLDPAGIAISTAASSQSGPAVAWNGADYLVVWTDGRTGIQVWGARVTGAGSVLDPAGIAIATGPGSQLFPDLAWNGTKFLVVWTDNRLCSCTDYDIFGTRVSGAGSVLDPAYIPISTATNTQTEAAVASRGDDFFVVWQDRRSGTNDDIYGAGVGGDGTVAQPAGIPISTAGQNQTVPDLAVRYDFLVAWRDLRFGTAYAVFATRVSPTGVVKEPSGFGVTGTGTTGGTVALTGGPGASWGVVYDRFATESPYGANRVFLRSVAPK
jgi:hypothetical protein